MTNPTPRPSLATKALSGLAGRHPLDWRRLLGAAIGLLIAYGGWHIIDRQLDHDPDTITTWHWLVGIGMMVGGVSMGWADMIRDSVGNLRAIGRTIRGKDDPPAGGDA